MITALSDEELVAKYQQAGQRGGAAYADELFQRHYSRVALWCLRICGDREQATDLAQEVFVKAWGHLAHFRSDAKFSTWLYTITRNHCFNAAKSRSRQREDAVEAADLDWMGSSPAGFDTALEKAELIETARSMMARELTPVEAKVMTLHFGEELPLATISQLLRLDNASGAKAYIVSAKRKLASALARATRKEDRKDERSGHD